MKFNSFYLIIFSLLFLQINSSFLKRFLQFSSDDEITDGTYLIKNFDGNLNLKLIDNTLYFSSNEDKHQLSRFLIYEKESKNKNKNSNENGYENYGDDDREKYYYIEEKSTKKKLYYDDATSSVLVSDKINPGDDDKFLWELNLKKGKNNIDYLEIKTKTKSSHISYEESDKELSKVYCENSWKAVTNDRKTKIRLIKLYRENLSINPNSSLLEKEPIDVVIKYIDLNDTSLDRKKYEQINKDKQNNELKYSLRSILKNIPWVRKIFIVMPNEKIPFLKEKEEIKDRIVYIKDKDLLGFDSSSPPTFQFNIHKLSQFNLSENFILMDDDYFIGQPLKKSDLFYEEKGKIYPYIISTEYSELDENDQRMHYTSGLSNIDNINYHSEEGFTFRKASSFVFLFKIFDLKDNIPSTPIEVGFTHNAIPLKISDVKDVAENIQQHYQYYVSCLTGQKRNMRSLQPQILFMNYARNIYDRLVNEISWKYYDLSDVRQVKLDTKLFVINVEDKEYHHLRFQTEEEVLKSLFPEPTKYEKEYNDIVNPNKNENENKMISTNDKNKASENEIKIRDINVKKNDDNNKDNKDKDAKSFDLNDLYNKIKDIVTKNNEDNKEDKKIEKNDENKKIREIQNINDKQEIKSINDKISPNNDSNNLTNDKRLEKISKELSNQKNDLMEKYQQIQNELVTLKSSINNSPQDNSLLIKKFQEFNQAQIDLGKKLSSLEKENSEIKKAQSTLSDNFLLLEKESKKSVDDNDEENSLKELYNNLYNQNERMKQTINKLSDENYSIGNKIIEMNSNMGEKDKKLKEIYEENYELKKKIKNLENEINNWKQKYENNMESSQRESSRNERNEQQINRLNNEISQLKETLNRMNSKNEEKKGFFSDNDNYKVKYGIIIIILMAVIYYAYKKCFGSEESSNEVRPMKLSQQYSGYGSYSNNLM